MIQEKKGHGQLTPQDCGHCIHIPGVVGARVGHEGKHGIEAAAVFVPAHGEGVGGEDRGGKGDVILGVTGGLQAAELQQQAGHAQLLLYIHTNKL